MDKFIIQGKEMRIYEVKKFGKSAHIILPQILIGEKVKVVII